MFDIRKYIRFFLRLILNLQSLHHNLSPGINPTDNVEPWLPPDNIVSSHLCDECNKSNEPDVCHKLWSILWQIEQVCSLTMECQVHQFLPSTSISRQIVSIHRTILQLIQVPPSWNDDHPCKALKLCTIVPSFCLHIHNISQRTFSRDLPCRWTTRQFLREIFSHLGNVFSCSCRNSWFEHFSVFVHNSFVRFCIHVECNCQMHVVKEWCWFVKINIFHQFLSPGSHILLLSSHVDVIKSIPIRNSPCLRWTNRHSQFATPSNPSSNRTSSNCLSYKKSSSGCPYKFLSRGTKGSSMFDPRFGPFVFW